MKKCTHICEGTYTRLHTCMHVPMHSHTQTHTHTEQNEEEKQWCGPHPTLRVVWCVQAGWKESAGTFTSELKNLKAGGLTHMGPSIKNAFDLLNLFRMQSGVDTYGQVPIKQAVGYGKGIADCT